MLLVRLGTKRETRMKAASAIVKALLDSGMNQQEIAARCGMTQATISKNLNGKTSANEITLARLTAVAKERDVELPRYAQWASL